MSRTHECRRLNLASAPPPPILALIWVLSNERVAQSGFHLSPLDKLQANRIASQARHKVCVSCTQAHVKLWTTSPLKPQSTHTILQPTNSASFHHAASKNHSSLSSIKCSDQRPWHCYHEAVVQRPNGKDAVKTATQADELQFRRGALS